ncbi:putative Transcription factor Rba50 [Seiridium cardinale]|uniref:Transcription factor Rba50 n=1 Tax=Seiridium cardinale TaxID=138064 RepID=A0ABR2XKN2_9PEZI
MASSMLIFDIKEKETSSPQAPSFPQNKSSTSGFPEHKKRTRISAFKQQRKSADETNLSKRHDTPTVPLPLKQDAASSGPSSAAGTSPVVTEKQKIDRENSERLASMSREEIDEARSELFNGLDPKILEMLLKRANLDEKNDKSPFEDEKPVPAPTIEIEDTSASQSKATASSKSKPTSAPRKVHFEDAPEEDDHVRIATSSASKPVTKESSTPAGLVPDAGDAEPPSVPHDHVHNEDCASSSTHWPQPRSAPELDPSDPNFLSSLHEKYFPQLPADPTKLAWMAPIPTANSPADFDSPYHPTHSSIPVSELRFDFRGALLPPRIARAVPASRGLHHHGEAPEAAGYTIKELARLARSAVAGQRCISYQTLGRIMYRLGHANYGSRGDSIPDGIWNAMVEGKVMESLYEEAGVDPEAPEPADKEDEEGGASGRGRGHRSAHAFAVEAIWLFEKGGWADKVRKGK